MRRWLQPVLLCALAVTAWPAFASAITPTEARDRITTAVQDLVELNYFVVDGYFHHGEFDKAVVILDRIIALQPTDTEAYATAAWLLWSSKKIEQATTFIDRMLAANPKNSMAYFEAGYYYNRLKDDQKSLAHLEQGVKLGLPAPQCYLYGYTLARLGRIDDALVFWREWLAAHPDDDTAKSQIEKLLAKKQEPAPTPTVKKPE